MIKIIFYVSYVTRSQEAILPAYFFNAQHRVSYGLFSGELNDTQLGSFFLLDEVNMDFINNRLRRPNRLAVTWFLI